MRREVTVVQRIQVEIDEEKFDPKFLQEFAETFYDFKTVEEHILHLGQMFARGIMPECGFVEGYGELAEMGIKVRDIDLETTLSDCEPPVTV